MWRILGGSEGESPETSQEAAALVWVKYSGACSWGDGDGSEEKNAGQHSCVVCALPKVLTEWVC